MKNNFLHPSFMTRIKDLNNKEVNLNNEYIIYYMQASVRTKFNHALECAIAKANQIEKPIIVVFCLQENFPEANLRSFAFLIEGLIDVKKSLKKRNIPFFVFKKPAHQLNDLFSKACLVFTDKGYLKVEREWKILLANTLNVVLIEVESNAIVPVEIASKKEEYSARTLRLKLNKLLDDYLLDVKEEQYKIDINQKTILEINNEAFEIEDLENCLNKLNVDKTVKPSPFFKGGEKQAQIILKQFFNEKLQHYNKDGSNPAKNFCSDLSPYLHYGHISTLEIYLKINNIKNLNTESFLEQLFVRRELSINFVYYNAFYDNYQCLPSWAKKTLQEHLIDERKIVYTQEQFENSQTHDIYWNAAQKEMINTGKMNSYMRMYWCKKIIEWSATPEQAYKIALYLNNKYSLDGRDANGFAGIAWCFGKHDRAWFQKPIFGLVRYMNQSGLTKKFDMKEYLIKQQNFKQEKF